MNAISIKLPDSMIEHLTQCARERGTSTSEVVRAALASYLQSSQAPARSAAAQAARWAGSVKSPKDLSTNPKHLDGYGQ